MAQGGHRYFFDLRVGVSWLPKRWKVRSRLCRSRLLHLKTPFAAFNFFQILQDLDALERVGEEREKNLENTKMEQGKHEYTPLRVLQTRNPEKSFEKVNIEAV